MRLCCSIEVIESFLFWVILIPYNIGIYICVYIYYEVSYIHSFFLLSLTVMFFLHCMLNILRYENKKIFCEIDESIASYHNLSSNVIFLGVHSESIFPLRNIFFSRKLCFLCSPCLLLIAKSISLDTSGKSTVEFFLKITSPSRIMLPISLDELNSVDWLLKGWWWIFLK